MSTPHYSIDETRASARNVNARRLFVLAFVSGALCIGFSELLSQGDNGLSLFSRLVGIAGPLLIMLIYFLEARKVALTANAVSLEQVADSLYFLGFLFTLCALLAALISLSDIDTASIVSRFALALITTIVGLFAKTAMTLFEVDDDQILAQARTTLANAVHDLTGTLNTASRKINDFVDESHKRFCYGTDQSIKMLTESAAQSVELLDNHTQKNLQKQADKGAACAEQLQNNASATIESLATCVSDATKRVATDYEHLVRESHARQEEMAELMVKTGESARSAINKLTEGTSGLCDRLSEKTTSTIDALDSLARTLEGAVQAQQGLTGRIHQVDDALNDSASTREALNTATTRLADISNDITTGLQTMVTKSITQVGDQDKRHADLVLSLEEMIDQWREAGIAGLDHSQQQLESTLGSLTQHLTNDSDRSSAASTELHVALRELKEAIKTSMAPKPRRWWF